MIDLLMHVLLLVLMYYFDLQCLILSTIGDTNDISMLCDLLSGLEDRSLLHADLYHGVNSCPVSLGSAPLEVTWRCADHLSRLLQMWAKRCIAVRWLSTMMISTIQPSIWRPSILCGYRAFARVAMIRKTSLSALPSMPP